MSAHEETVLRSIEEFRQARREAGAEGVSWIRAAEQLDVLIRRHPERARAVLAEVDRAHRPTSSTSSGTTGMVTDVSWTTPDTARPPLDTPKRRT